MSKPAVGVEGERVPDIHAMPSGYLYGFWALGRPMTKTWGSGGVWKRLAANFGEPDAAFGKTDGIPEHVRSFDHKNGYEWKSMPDLKDGEFAFGYWDPPYDKLYKPELLEIWRTCRKLAILHTHCYPTSWMKDAKRIGGVAITMGPLKQIRFLQIFERAALTDLASL
jgi:hypothetical protein